MARTSRFGYLVSTAMVFFSMLVLGLKYGGGFGGVCFFFGTVAVVLFVLTLLRVKGMPSK